jgi:hypothetical protein
MSTPVTYELSPEAKHCDVRHLLGPAKTAEQRLAEHRSCPLCVLQLLTTMAPSRANVRAASRPMLPPVPVMMQTFSESRDDMTCLPITLYVFPPAPQVAEEDSPNVPGSNVTSSGG